MIVHGGTSWQRLEVAERLARAVLCEAEPMLRPCGECRHCRRVEVAADSDAFHPDFRVLYRDLKTSTSVDATRKLLQVCLQTPFEAKAQAFVLAEAETLSNEAANALLKILEEPPSGAPRHFLLLAPSRQDLLPTLRSRSWEIYLGGGDGVDAEAVRQLAERLGPLLDSHSGMLTPMRLAMELEAVADFKDPRAEKPWAFAAAVVSRLAVGQSPGELRRRLLGLAEDLLDAPRWRLRGIPPQRLLEGLAVRHLRGSAFAESLSQR
jgi:DNA polymerase-3 subunit delta'